MADTVTSLFGGHKIISRMNKARLSFRSFDPREEFRLSGHEAVRSVAASLGVLAPLLPPQIDGSSVHNVRAAFIAGLADGMDKLLLMMQEGDDPIPLDYRDYVKRYRHPGDINAFIGDFAVEVFAAMQCRRSEAVEVPKTFLASLDLGASFAENEYDLRLYYLETHEYRLALRGEGRIVLGRKGSGKTAIFVQARDQIRTNRSALVVDLNPEGYQLKKFREQVIDLLEDGTKEHTITVFWEYILLIEICARIIEQDKSLHLRDGRLFDDYQAILNRYGDNEYIADGDFSSRLSRLVNRVATEFRSRYDRNLGRRFTHAEVTELLYSLDLPELMDMVKRYVLHKGSLWILFDNIDKGWSTSGITYSDLLLLRALLEATRKLERTMRRDGVACSTLVFVRNDVYEMLVEKTPDRGKEGKIPLDWTDADMLREMLRRRFQYNGVSTDRPFNETWGQICVSHIQGEESSQYFIERCLMRPRCLLNLLNNCISIAANLGHPSITEEDVRKGLYSYSIDLITEIGYEIRDVFPDAEHILYAFIGAPVTMNTGTIRYRLEQANVGTLRLEALVEMLLWFGVFGVVRGSGTVAYIYSVNYDMGLMRGIIANQQGTGMSYHVNPAFWPALEIQVD